MRQGPFWCLVAWVAWYGVLFAGFVEPKRMAWEGMWKDGVSVKVRGKVKKGKVWYGNVHKFAALPWGELRELGALRVR